MDAEDELFNATSPVNEEDEIDEEDEQLDELEKENVTGFQDDEMDVDDDDEDEDNDEENDEVDDDEDDDDDDDGEVGEVESTPETDASKIFSYYETLQNNSKLAENYTITPTAAIPYQAHVNALTMSKGLKYIFLGGNDGYIRKYDFLNTVDGKLPLTILQKHSLVESVSNAGILVSYWENEMPLKQGEIVTSTTARGAQEYEVKVSPVHSLEVQSECVFLLSGLDDGGITLQGVRFSEGIIGHYFKEHTAPVNLLRLNNSENKFVSGSWDKTVKEWDLNTGDVINSYQTLGQVSSLEYRPINCSEIQADEDLDSLFGDEDETKPPELNHSTLKINKDENVFMTSQLNGSITIWDARTRGSVLNMMPGSGTPPWAMSACWSADGGSIFAGRRNAMVEEYDIKMPNAPSKQLKFPTISGPVSCVKAMPNGNHVLCASVDNIRMYDVRSDKLPFTIIPGHHGGTISDMYVDPTCRFLVTTSGNRGWQGNSTDSVLIYDIDLET